MRVLVDTGPFLLTVDETGTEFVAIFRRNPTTGDSGRAERMTRAQAYTMAQELNATLLATGAHHG